MTTASGNRHYVRETLRNLALTGSVVAPRQNRAVIEQRQAVPCARRYGEGIRNPSWHRALAIIICAPGAHLSLLCNGKAVIAASDDGDGIRQRCGNRAL